MLGPVSQRSFLKSYMDGMFSIQSIPFLPPKNKAEVEFNEIEQKWDSGKYWGNSGPQLHFRFFIIQRKVKLWRSREWETSQDDRHPENISKCFRYYNFENIDYTYFAWMGKYSFLFITCACIREGETTFRGGSQAAFSTLVTNKQTNIRKITDR